MLFSSPSPRQRRLTLRACAAKNIAACPAEFPAPTMWTSRPCVFGASLRAAPYEMPFPARRSNPSTRSRRQRDAAGEDDRPRAQDVAAVEVDEALAASTRTISRVTRISAPSRRACCSARLASSSPETPDGKPR